MAPLWHHMSSYWKITFSLGIWPNMKVRWQNLNFKLFSELGKIWKCNLGFQKPNFASLLWIGKNLEIYTVPDQHFKIPMLSLWMSWQNLCPNLSFTVESKMENSHKSGWSHFKLKINERDIPFTKNWSMNWEKIFPLGKTEWTH